MEFHEYPKHLYLDGDKDKADRVVADSKAEADARKEGFRMIGDPVPEEKKAKK